MTKWPKYPSIYEINAWVWLDGLTRKHKRSIALDSVPDDEWDALSSKGFDAVWMMGVWERSPRGRQIALANATLMEDFRRALPDFDPRDVAGSPYCVRRYVVDDHLGGPAGLARAREALRARGLRLILDFVPNHVAPDHPWTTEHPEYFIAGDAGELREHPDSYLESGGGILACGRDPFFPPWPDVAQLNAFNPGLRQAVRATLSEIAGQCDGVRCDMAMLFLTSVFAKTWGGKAGQTPQTEYWEETIAAIKQEHPDFLFLAEAYWDLEWELQRQGFDFCYDKRLYDRLANASAEKVREHLQADLPYQEKLLRFLENHDEPRAASAFASPRDRAAAVAAFTLPGARLFHEGQFAGRKIRLPVFLSRLPEEAEDQATRAFYDSLLENLKSERVCDGEWRLCGQFGWADNNSQANIVAWTWKQGDARHLVAVNLAAAPAQATLRPAWDDIGDGIWTFTDLLSGRKFERHGSDVKAQGLFVDLEPYAYHLFGKWSLSRVNA